MGGDHRIRTGPARRLPHFCLGASPARMFLHTAYEALFSRCPSLFLAVSEDDIPWEPDLFFTKPAMLPVAWD
ncbi:hypothetical protein ACFRFS_20960, partial [Streptomyces sp. NPDC056730]